MTDADLYERVRAMPVITGLWPGDAIAGSAFASDPSPASISTYVVARILLLEALRWLAASAKLAEDDRSAAHGAHVLLLRPALVVTAKCAWMIRPDDSNTRAARAVRLVVEDRRQGASAMDKARQQGAPEAFGHVGRLFERARTSVIAAAGINVDEIDERPPRDEEMILELGCDIDQYYGTRSGRSDLQLLWNAASSLAHGERWYTSLTGGERRKEVARVLTFRSTDAVCSAINVTHLRLLWLALPTTGRAD